MRKYLIRFNEFEVLAIIPVADGSNIVGTAQMLLTSIERAKIMLAALGVNIALLEQYKEPSIEE
jgi:hypothetical protein